jgi:tryptophan 2,3-dioxygenase
MYLIHLVDKDYRNKINFNSSINEQFEHIYWKAGATDIETGKKTLTLIQFEEKKNGFFSIRSCI